MTGGAGCAGKSWASSEHTGLGIRIFEPLVLQKWEQLDLSLATARTQGSFVSISCHTPSEVRLPSLVLGVPFGF